MSISKERREKLRAATQYPFNTILVQAPDPIDSVSIDFSEFRALLDMADERDRYRALLVEARSWIDGDKWKVTQLPRELVNLYLNLVERIDAALEGK